MQYKVTGAYHWVLAAVHDIGVKPLVNQRETASVLHPNGRDSCLVQSRISYLASELQLGSCAITYMPTVHWHE